MASQLSFTGFAWKNLWRRRLRTLLTLVGITMGIGAFVALVGFSRAFEHEWMRMYTSRRHRHRRGPEQTSSTRRSMSRSAPRISAVPDVARVRAHDLQSHGPDAGCERIWFMAGAPTPTNSIPSPSSPAVGFTTAQPEMLLGDLLAGNLKKKPGDIAFHPGHNFHGGRHLSRRHCA